MTYVSTGHLSIGQARNERSCLLPGGLRPRPLEEALYNEFNDRLVLLAKQRWDHHTLGQYRPPASRRVGR
eukprot:1654730-Rhodomonas_salina.1